MWSKRIFKVNLLILFFLNFLIIACNIKISASGYQDRIYIVADSLFWSEVKSDILDVFQAPIYTPITENEFEVQWINLADLNKYKKRMNVFIIGVADQENPTSTYLNQILPEKFKEGVKQNNFFYLFNDDLFAREQVGLIMYAQNLGLFKDNFSTLKKEIYNTFTNKYYERLKREMYDKGEQKDIEKILAENFGWSVRVQHDYFIAVQDVEDKYVWLRRIDPDRWLSMWEIAGDSSQLELDSLLVVRDRILGENYEGDKVVKEDTYLTITEFSGQSTIKVIGVWQNEKHLVGGPFRMYVMSDPQTSKLYFIDIVVMAPDKAKKSYLDQLEVMANTFKLVNSKKKN